MACFQVLASAGRPRWFRMVLADVGMNGCRRSAALWSPLTTGGRILASCSDSVTFQGSVLATKALTCNQPSMRSVRAETKPLSLRLETYLSKRVVDAVQRPAWLQIPHGVVDVLCGRK